MTQKPLKLGPGKSGPLFKTIVKNRDHSLRDDLYFSLLSQSWTAFFGTVAAGYLLANALFALLYMAQPGCIQNARVGDFFDHFFFSVQTMATIGYGNLSPQTLYSHTLVTLEAVLGMLVVAVLTGITFAKFARPTARVVFSKHPLIAQRDGVPHLMFRLANFRHNQIVEAELRVFVLVTQRTREGDEIRVPHELSLVRSTAPAFALTWTAMHRIDEGSPFFGEGALERLSADKSVLILSLTGLDETLGQTVHARAMFPVSEVRRGVRFADVLTELPDGTRELDYAYFHDYVPIEGEISQKDE